MQQPDILLTIFCSGDHLICLLILLFYVSREEKKPASLPEYVKKWKGTLQEALNIASRNAHAKVESGKLQYDKKVCSTALEPGDRVLIHNLSERGGPGKVRSYWEQDVYTVVKRERGSPVYIVKKENGQGIERVLHRNLLLQCDFLPVDPVPAPLTKDKKGWRKSIWNRKKASAKKASQEMSSLEHSCRDDTDSDEELPSLEFIQHVQDHCQNVSEQAISQESVDSTAGSSVMTGTPAFKCRKTRNRDCRIGDIRSTRKLNSTRGSLTTSCSSGRSTLSTTTSSSSRGSTFSTN